ncbi:MAG: AAA family ATPase, partial [Clostridiales bacterium]|nr:AAA family ATPase [Clostridiales bacterium]
MRLTKIKIENYRLLLNSELIVDEKTTLIVGRNNTGKTSCNDLVNNVIKGKALEYDDYPLAKREVLYDLLYKFMKQEISYPELKKGLPITALEFWVDYSLDAPEDNLGALSPFIIDVDESITEAIVRIEYSLKKDEERLREIFIPYFYDGDNFNAENSDVHDAIADNFQKIFELVIYAVNPLNMGERQVKSVKELVELFPFYSIPAERELGGDGTQKKSSLGKLITSYFDVKEEDLDPGIAKEMIELRKVVEKANSEVQKKSDELLGSVVNKAIGFGYPNGEELQLAVNTKLQIDDQIKNQTELAYTSDFQNETLPSSHNGLGYLNLIKMEFLLAAYAKEIENQSESCIPLVFIEEPESHMHPQMQHNFADYLETFLGKISNVHIQTFVTTHSSHIANTIDFSKIRYAKRTKDGVIFKNLKSFVDSGEADVDFIKKYLTLSRCDLFFADKVIFVEGASERLLIPDMISKCEAEGLFKPQKYNLSAQYYALIEIGGAYAKEFIPFVKFLDIPCLILTDIDSVGD